MAEDLSQSSLEQSGAPAAERQKRLVTPFARKEKAGGYRARFMVAYVILGLALTSAGGGFGLLLMNDAGGGSSSGGGGWSDWKPTADGKAGVDQIANYVAARYRLPSGRQLVAVLGDKPLVQNQIPVSTVAVEDGTKDAAGDPNYTLHDTGGDYMYVLCGLGQNCAINEGPASVERHRLLRREALELALYTFRYVDGVDSIIAFLPPRKGQQPTSLLFFRKKELETHLDRPLQETLPGEKPPPMNSIPEGERKVIDQLTTRNLFRYEFIQGPESSAILALKPQFPSS